MDAGKGRHHLFPSAVVKISNVVERRQCLRKVDQREARVEDTADKADDEGGRERAGLLWHGIDVVHQLRGEVHG